MEYVKHYKGYKIARYDNNDYVLVFHHNSTNKILFSQDRNQAFKEVTFINEVDRFSILGSVSDSFYIDNKYNFIFHNPDDFPNTILQFNQSSHPLFTTTAKNVEIKYITQPNCRVIQDSNRFQGLIVDYQYSLIDGNPNTNWNFAIGSFSFHKGGNTIPGLVMLCDGVYNPAHTNDLYIRIQNLKLIDSLPILNSKYASIDWNPVQYSRLLVIFEIIIIY